MDPKIDVQFGLGANAIVEFETKNPRKLRKTPEGFGKVKHRLPKTRPKKPGLVASF